MCTRDEVITFEYPVLFPSVPVTYVITMEGSTRYDQLMKELHSYRPTHKVVIVHHKPMSEYARPEWVETTADDLWRNNLNILARDIDHPVLILEDDVHFLPRVRKLSPHIDRVISNEECEVYSLGIMPLLALPPFLNFDTRILAGFSTQAVLFSIRGRRRLIREYINEPSFKTKHWLVWLHDFEVYLKFDTLTPGQPCAVQAFPLTENQKVWGNKFYTLIFQLLGADEDGTNLFELLHAMSYFGGVIPVLTGVIVSFLCTIRKKRLK